MKRIGILMLGFLFCFVLSTWAQAPKIITIDVSGAGTTVAGQGTYAFSINDAGAITGWFVDANWVWHGFLRAPNGFITPFDAPGAGLGIDSYEGTVAYMISPSGAITGFYEDVYQVNHGFLRAPDGTFTAINAPGAGSAGTGPYAGMEGTFGGSINLSGEIFGWLIDASDVSHAFLRAPNGEITEFNVRGAGDAAGQGTTVAFNTGINAVGTATGEYWDPNSALHGYVRAPYGVITVFSVLGAGTGAGQGTEPSGINDAGAITGTYVDANGVAHGFLRAPSGAITIFNYSGAGTASGQGTFGTMINDLGWIVGGYIDANGVNHGLLRTPEGALIPFDAPGAGTGSGQGTVPIFINDAVAITGYYADSGGVYHGFLRMP